MYLELLRFILYLFHISQIINLGTSNDLIFLCEGSVIIFVFSETQSAEYDRSEPSEQNNVVFRQYNLNKFSATKIALDDLFPQDYSFPRLLNSTRGTLNRVTTDQNKNTYLGYVIIMTQIMTCSLENTDLIMTHIVKKQMTSRHFSNV